MSFNILAIGQSGRLEFEAILLAASLRALDPGFTGTLFIAEPQPGGAWPGDPRMSLSAIPFDFTRPAASMRRENTWPSVELYGPTPAETWKSLYDRFGLDFNGTLDLSQPDGYWQRYLYFNAGWFFHKSPQALGTRFLSWATKIRDTPPPEIACQKLYPWLDQITLPLVIHSFGGGRPGPELSALDGSATCHYRALPLLYARESNHVVAVLEEVAKDKQVRPILRDWPAMKAMVYQNQGRRARALFDRDRLPRREQMVRNALRREGLWVR